jgi:hypothetical protein
VLLPFEYTTTLGAKPISVYATYGYNIFGDERARRLGMPPTTVPAQTQAQIDAFKAALDTDASIYNVGVRYGENKFAGDYQLTAEYRHVGNGSFSSLLLDSDFNGGLLNGEGFILSGVYSWTPAITSTVTYFNSFNIEKGLPAGASRGNGFGEAHVLQIDLSAKF